jgi:hypothetical protein
MSDKTRRRPDRTGTVRSRLGSGLEVLETRQLMTLPPGSYHPYEIPQPFPTDNPVNLTTNPLSVAQPVGITSDAQLAQLDNEGKFLTGKDRQGNEWTLEVHGPGDAIVTDVTPNDGVFDDDINTIQLVGTSPETTTVTGNVTASTRLQTSGVVLFNHLISENGVKSIVLNGFTLADTAFPTYAQPLNSGPDIYLPGGVQTLAFHDVIANIDEAGNVQPMQIVIGDPTTPMKQQPTIRIDSIFNTVFDSSAGAVPNGVPRTTPTVNIMVNGVLQGLQILSATETPVNDGNQYNFPTVGATGRTAVRALAINHLKVIGGVNNLTVSRGGTPFQPQTGQPGTPPPPSATTTQPFQGSFSGLAYLRRAEFGGPTDALGLDVHGPIGSLRFLKGLGNPTGTAPLAATSYGVSAAQAGYGNFGMLGGLVTAARIRRLEVDPANLILQTPNNPDFMQIDRTGTTKFFARPGWAMTNAAIVSAGSIGKTRIVGNAQASEIAAGFDYPSFTAGLEPVRSPSVVRRFQQRGDLVDAVISSTYRPTNAIFGDFNPRNGTTDDVAGPGQIAGNLHGRLFNASSETALSNFGVGFYARRKIGYLPPPVRPLRVRNILKSG